MTKTAKPRVPVSTCPHCNERAFARSSKTFSPLYREVHFRCDNDACGHLFVIGMQIVRTTSPSRMPNPAIHLPVTNRPPHPANDDGPVVPPAAANDDVMTDTA